MIITRKQVLKALREEPLKSGSFVNSTTGNLLSNINSRCNVCAVGSVFRNVLKNKKVNMTLSSLDYLCSFVTDCTTVDYDSQKEMHKEIKTYLKYKDFISALSMKFEWLAEEHPMKLVRKKIINFVKKNFPKQFKVNVDLEHYIIHE